MLKTVIFASLINTVMGEMGETAQKSSTLKYIIQNTIRYNFVAHNMNFDSNITTNQ